MTTTLTLAPGVAFFTVKVGVDLISAIEPCASVPEACDGSENFRSDHPVVFGCSDNVDNDGDGITDSDDPDCIGVQGWSLSVETEDCFGIADATTVGTAVPQAVDPVGSFATTEVVAPNLNGGRKGAVSRVVLSVLNPVILDQVGEFRILNLTVFIDVSGLGPGEMAGPCRISVLNTAEGEPPLFVGGLPVTTAVSVNNQTRAPSIRNLAIVARVELPFRRGECNNDGSLDLSDGIFVLGYLFQGGLVPACLEACDMNGDGTLDVSDAVFLLNFLFVGGVPPPPPFQECEDHPGSLGCEDSNC